MALEPPQSGENHDRRLVAGVGDDALGVHVLTEFLFCPRAGVIAHESEDKDSGQDVRPVRLGYLPRYEQARIAEAIGRVTVYLLGGCFGGLLGIGLFCVLAFTVSKAFLIGCWLLLIALIVAVLAGIYALVVLTHRYSEASGAKPKEPQFSSDRPVAVDWWGLIAAGFEVRIWPDPLELSDWKMAGRPWRMLVRGETYIPVFLRNGENRELHKQHFARIAAYCELLQRQARGVSPYGVILYAGTQDAVAIPNSNAAKRALADGAAGMRRLLGLLKGGLQPEPPQNKRLCFSCPHALLDKYHETPLRPEDSEPYFVEIGGKRFHSVCGDRFRWNPPREG